MSNQSNDNVKYNDSADTGIGYLNRARTVSPKGAEPYESVTIAGLRGRVDKPNYTYYDCKVIAKALPKFLLLKDAINDDKETVVIRYKVSDSYPDSYETNDRETGKAVRRHVIKGKLLNITWASIDGQEVEFELDEEDSDAQDQSGGESVNDNPSQPQSYFCGIELGEFMKLDREDPDFTGKQAELKALGYNGLDNDGRSWHKPESAAA